MSYVKILTPISTHFRQFRRQKSELVLVVFWQTTGTSLISWREAHIRQM